MGRQPYKVLIKPARIQYDEDDISAIEQKLGKISDVDLELRNADKDKHGKSSIRVTKTGVWLKVTPPKGDGKKVDVNDVTTTLYSMRLNSADMAKVEKEVKKASGKPVKIGEWVPNPEFDSTMSVEITEDEMKAVVHFSPPRFSGRHMDMDDILDSLKANGVVTGINEEKIAEYLENMNYSQPLIAAEGVRPRHGRDAYIDYKVRIDKTDVTFEEDEKGQVNFRDLDLLENVVVGQVLAVKVPAEEGVPGRTVTNRIIPARSGKDTQIKHGKGTILSEDGTELTAEINGRILRKR